MMDVFWLISQSTVFFSDTINHYRTLSHFLIKRARKICNKSSNCAHMCLTLTKITMGSLSKFSCKRQFIVIFVIVKHNLKICCEFLIVYTLVLWQNNTRCIASHIFSTRCVVRAPIYRVGIPNVQVLCTYYNLHIMVPHPVLKNFTIQSVRHFFYKKQIHTRVKSR